MSACGSTSSSMQKLFSCAGAAWLVYGWGLDRTPILYGREFAGTLAHRVKQSGPAHPAGCDSFGRSGALSPPNLSVASPRWRTQIICRRDWVCFAPQVGVPETGCPRQSYGLRIERFLNWMARAGSHDPWGSYWFVIRERCKAPRTRLELPN